MKSKYESRVKPMIIVFWMALVVIARVGPWATVRNYTRDDSVKLDGPVPVVSFQFKDRTILPALRGNFDQRSLVFINTNLALDTHTTPSSTELTIVVDNPMAYSVLMRLEIRFRLSCRAQTSDFFLTGALDQGQLKLEADNLLLNATDYVSSAGSTSFKLISDQACFSSSDDDIFVIRFSW